MSADSGRLWQAHPVPDTKMPRGSELWGGWERGEAMGLQDRGWSPAGAGAFPTRNRSPFGSQTCSSCGFWSRWGRRGAGHPGSPPLPCCLGGGVGARPAGSSHEAARAHQLGQDRAMDQSKRAGSSGRSRRGRSAVLVALEARGLESGPSRGSPLAFQQHRLLLPQPFGAAWPFQTPARQASGGPASPTCAGPAGPWEG